MVRTDGHLITNFSRMGRLLHFLFHGALLARFARKSSAKSNERQQNNYDLKTQLLTYCSLLSALKSLWRRLSNLSDCTNNGKEYESFLTKLSKCQKPSRLASNALVAKTASSPAHSLYWMDGSLWPTTKLCELDRCLPASFQKNKKHKTPWISV